MALAESRRRQLQLRRSLGIALLAWALVAGAQVTGILHAFDLKLLDLRFRLRGERPAHPSIALVCLDDATLRAYGEWPLSREAYALLVIALREAGARGIGFDLQLPEDPRQSSESNRLLAAVSGPGSSVVHAIGFRSETAGGADLSAARHETLARHGVPPGRLRLAEAVGPSVPYAELFESGASLGHIAVAVDADGAIRRIPLLVRHRGLGYPALSLQLAGRAHGDSLIPPPACAPGGARVTWSGGASVLLPADEEGAARIDFAGDLTAFAARHSMIDVLQWYREGHADRLRQAFAGRVVLVGLTAREEASEDLGPTPFAPAGALLLVHANAIDNLLRGRFLRGVPVALHLGALLVMALALGLLCAQSSVPSAAMFAAAGLAGFALADQALFSRLALDVPPLSGLLLPGLVFAGVQAGRRMQVERASRQREEEIREGFTVQQRFLPDALVGRTLSHYRIEEKIGGGGMGIVYRAHDAREGRTVAVKVLIGGALADGAQRRRFRREARLQARFKHPGAATLYEFDSQDGADFMVMEFVRGVSLAERLRKGRLEDGEALRIAADIAEVLVEAHARGIVHRDIKPANIMLTPEGRTKLLDFGVAFLAASATASESLVRTITETGGIVGTPAYLAPEVILGEPATAAADLYGLGVVLFEMTTGRRPFADDVPLELMYMILHQNPTSPRVLNAKLTERVESIILRALEKRPEARFESASRMLEALRSATSPLAAGRA